MWDQEETEALRKLFEGHMAGRKPPVGFISSLLRDKKETEEGKALVKQKGTNSQKNSGQYVICFNQGRSFDLNP